MKPSDETAIDFTELLELKEFTSDAAELGAREFRIRGIDVVINDLKKSLDKEEANALNRYLQMCPTIDCLITHLQSDYPEFKTALADYLPKLHAKVPKLTT